MDSYDSSKNNFRAGVGELRVSRENTFESTKIYADIINGRNNINAKLQLNIYQTFSADSKKKMASIH